MIGCLSNTWDSPTYQTKSFAILANKMQTVTPIAVGMITASAVHFQLFVSFFMVSNVVEQGQCMRENNMVLTAVIQVQPWLTNNSFNWVRLSSSRRLPWDI